MANAEQVALLKAGVEGWNEWWRDFHWETPIDLSRADLSRVNLNEAFLDEANLTEANLTEADLTEADLTRANLTEANLTGADLSQANLTGADLSQANLTEASLSQADLFKADLFKAELTEADLTEADLTEADLFRTNLTRANLTGANLSQANLREANLSQASLRKANLSQADIREANLSQANLRETNLNQTNLTKANLQEAELSGAYINRANLNQANLSGAKLVGAHLLESELTGADLTKANLNQADLSGANLIISNLMGAHVHNTKISKSLVHGVNVWDLDGEFQEQKDLIITPEGDSPITVDNIKVAQFVYLILNNKEIRDVINTLTSKTVLILGRFAIPERKEILDALRDKLRRYNLLPIVFDFERPLDKDFTETIKTLASISYFVIADVTNPKSSPLELQATIPDYQIPFVPIIQEGEYPFAMMVDLQKKYNWVLDTISYDSLDTLIEILKPYIIDPAIRKRDELRLIKAKEPTIISGRELRDKKNY